MNLNMGGHTGNLFGIVFSIEEYIVQILIFFLILLTVLLIILINERRKIQKALQQKVLESSAIEKLNSTVIERSPIGISVRDRHGKLLQYNQAWYTFWHITDENLTDYLRRDRWELKFDDRDNYLKEWQDEVGNVYKNGGQLHIPEIKVTDNKKEEKWISHYFYAITDDNNIVERVVILTEDITDRKKYEIALSDSEEKYRTLLENLPIGVYRTDPEGKFISINNKMAQMYGYDSPEEMMQKVVLFDQISNVDKETILKRLKETGEIDDFEVQLTNKKLNVQWVLGSIKSEKDSDDNLLYFDGIDIDITEKKIAELALIKEQETLNQVIELNPYAICIFDKDGRYYKHNKAFFKLFKTVPTAEYSTFKNKTIEDLGLADEYKSNLHAGKNYYFNEVEFNAHDLSSEYPDISLIMSVISFPIMDEKNELEFVINMYENVTEKKQAERALAKERNTLNNIIDLNPYPISITKSDGHFHKGNKAFVDLFKIPPPPDYNIYNDPIVGKVYDLQLLKEQLQKGESISVSAMEYNTYLVDSRFPNNPLTIQLKLFPIMDENNELEYIVCMYADITTQTKAIANLKESEEKFRSFAENTAAAIFIHVDGKIKYMNPEAIRLIGYTYEESQKISLLDVISPEYQDIAMKNIQRRMQGEDVPSYEILIVNKMGQKKWVILTAGVINYQGEKSILGTAFDISSKKKAEEELAQIQKARYSQVKEIAGGVAHEIYNSLFPAVSSIEKLKQRLSERNIEEIERNLKLINLTDKAVARAIDMTELVMEFSKLETQQEKDEIKLDDYFKRFIETFKDEKNATDIQFKIEIDPGIVLHINSNHLYSLFNNILSNAFESFESGDKIIEVTAKKESGFYRISLANNGVPIPSDIRDKIFNPFYSTKPKSGTGLGLAICKKIIEIHNGELTLQETIDNKTEFVILFPVEPR